MTTEDSIYVTASDADSSTARMCSAVHLLATRHIMGAQTQAATAALGGSFLGIRQNHTFLFRASDYHPRKSPDSHGWLPASATTSLTAPSIPYKAATFTRLSTQDQHRYFVRLTRNIHRPHHCHLDREPARCMWQQSDSWAQEAI